MLQSLDFAIIGVLAEKRLGMEFGHQFLKALNFVGTIEKLSAIYQFKPKNLKINVKGEMGMTHLSFSILLHLKDIEDWGKDFGRQVQKISESVSESVGIKNFEVQILDFRSQFAMCQSVALPYPHWLDRQELLYPSLEILPKDYIHPVLNAPLQDFLSLDNTWKDSAFLKTGKSLFSLDDNP